MHDSSLITLIIFMISGLVALKALSYYSERLMLFPSVIWVLCLGMIYGALNHFKLLHLPELYLDPNIILFALGPVLIFAATKKMCLHHFRKVLKESSLLATSLFSLLTIIFNAFIQRNKYYCIRDLSSLSGLGSENNCF